MKFHGTPPTAEDVYKTLISLLEDQWGVKITYELKVIKDGEEDDNNK